ncbi:MAG: glucose-1-phosphate adenylyltransferase [Myxococcales bacterium]|nr:glucose-1-phosphate adenylyltransferase [Myxococcales bacterium]
MARTLAMIMAGGKGTRLTPLTSYRAKPAVPFGGRYRIIDFVLSNFINSGYHRIKVLTQYMSSSLITHLNRNWHLGGGLDQYIDPVPAQMRRGEHWYVGTADSVYQNLNLIQDDHAEHVAVFGGDHIYKIAVDQMEACHAELDADLTIAAYPATKEEASAFGVIEVDTTGRITGFQEKPSPAEARTIPGRPDTCLVSMGNYFFKRKVLEELLIRDSEDPTSTHDFGKDIIPRMVREGFKVFIYDFSTNRVPGESVDAEPYWRDVGTIDSFFDANMDLRAVLPAFNLYNRKWPIRTAMYNLPPAKFVLAGKQREYGQVIDSLVCEGTIVSGAVLLNVVAGTDCYFHRFASIENSVMLGQIRVGRSCWLRNVLADHNVSIADGTTIGYHPDQDRQRFPFVSPRGMIVLPKGTHVPAEGPIEVPEDMVFMLQQDPAVSDILKARPESFVSVQRHSNDAVRAV